MRRYFLAICFVSGLLHAQDPHVPTPINTDRPAFADSSVVVPKGSLQIENGFLETTALGQQGFDFPESQFRFGLGDKTELRFSVPDYYQNFLFAQGFGSGWGDSLAGIKQQLGPFHGFDISLVAALSFPTGGHSASSHGYDPELQLPWSLKLSTNWTAAGMFSVYWPTQDAPQNTTRNTTGQATLLFDRQLTAPWDAFVEYGGEFPRMGGPIHLLHFGTAYKLTPHQQIDLHGGAGLSSAAPSYFIGFGYSILLHVR